MSMLKLELHLSGVWVIKPNGTVTREKEPLMAYAHILGREIKMVEHPRQNEDGEECFEEIPTTTIHEYDLQKYKELTAQGFVPIVTDAWKGMAKLRFSTFGSYLYNSGITWARYNDEYMVIVSQDGNHIFANIGGDTVVLNPDHVQSDARAFEAGQSDFTDSYKKLLMYQLIAFLIK